MSIFKTKQQAQKSQRNNQKRLQLQDVILIMVTLTTAMFFPLHPRVLSDDQAQEVTSLLTPPDKELPPIPRSSVEPVSQTSEIGSSIDSHSIADQSSSALDKLDRSGQLAQLLSVYMDFLV